MWDKKKRRGKEEGHRFLFCLRSRLRDSGEKAFSKKKCEKRAGAGERQPPPPFPSRARLIFNTSALYYLRAWHRLRNFGSQVTGRPSTPQGNQCQISHFLANVGAVATSMFWSIDSCQNKVSIDQYHMTVSRVQVLTHRGCMFSCFQVIR